MIENRPGAGAIIGTDAVAKSAPDGYTLLVMSNAHTTNESLIPTRPYELMRDFAPISPINSSDLLMVAHPSTGVKNLKDFIALAKSKPGVLNYASSGPGTPYHMAGELFKAMSGTDIVHVPHKTSGDMRTSVIGGHVQMMFDAITVMAEGVRQGHLVGLGTTGSNRSMVMPDMPTVAEGGCAGLRGDDLDRAHGAGRNAEGGHRPAQRGNCQDHEPGRREGGLGQAGRRPDAAPARADLFLLAPPQKEKGPSSRRPPPGRGGGSSRAGSPRLTAFPAGRNFTRNFNLIPPRNK